MTTLILRISGFLLVPFLLTQLAMSCPIDAPVPPPKERRIVIFWDVSQSITVNERDAWVQQLEDDLKSRWYGSELYYKHECDRLELLPLHGSTASSSVWMNGQFTGGPSMKRKRSMEYRAYLDTLGSFQARTFSREAMKWTDILSAIDRFEKLGVKAETLREIWFFSDMMHSTHVMDFEKGNPMTNADALVKARAIVARRGWSSKMLTGVRINIRLPSNLTGRNTFSQARKDGVEAFWNALFSELGVEAKRVSWVQK